MRPLVALLSFWLLFSFSISAAPAPLSTSTSKVPSFDPAVATRAWLDSMPMDAKNKSDAYFEGGYWLILWDYLVSAGIALILLASGLSARLRTFAEGRTRFRPLQVAIYALAFSLIVALLSFPLAFYETFIREHQYGMSTQNFPAWFSDWVKALLVQLIITPLLLMVLYAVFRRAPQRWWVIGAVVALIFFIFGAVLSPIFIDPLFNKYTPLTDAQIRDPILQLARANEIPVDKVFVVDASRQTKRVSANVAGFLGTTRIALNDNLLQCSLPEIREVMAHEMGHFVLNHIFKFFAFIFILSLVAFGLAKLIFDWALRRWGSKWQVSGIADPGALPLLMLIFATLGLLGTPILNSFIRTQEREADAFALNAAREPDAAAKVALKLGVYRKMEPWPLEEALLFDHPSGRSRIRMAMDWKAANPPSGTYDPKVGRPE